MTPIRYVICVDGQRRYFSTTHHTDNPQHLSDQEGPDHNWRHVINYLALQFHDSVLIHVYFKRVVCGHATRKYKNHPVCLGPSLIHDTLFLTCEHGGNTDGSKMRIHIIHAALQVVGFESVLLAVTLKRPCMVCSSMVQTQKVWQVQAHRILQHRTPKD